MKALVINLIFSLLCLSRGGADSSGYADTVRISVSGAGFTFHHTHNWSDDAIRGLKDVEFFSEANRFSRVRVTDAAGGLVFRSPSPALTDLWISPDGEFFAGLSRIKLRNPFQLVVWRRDGTLFHCGHITENCARISPEQIREFSAKFPAAVECLTKNLIHAPRGMFIEPSTMTRCAAVNDDVWHFLYGLPNGHPYSDYFGGSVTNHVYWYDRKRPDISMEQTGGAWVLHARSPVKGELMTIPLHTEPERYAVINERIRHYRSVTADADDPRLTVLAVIAVAVLAGVFFLLRSRVKSA